MVEANDLKSEDLIHYKQVALDIRVLRRRAR
jgi:hypothetical protein